jgi:soluble lytic murein transglycosylase-like protein
MRQVPRSIIAFFSGLGVLAIALGASLQAEKASVSFLEDGQNPYQAKSPFRVSERMPLSVMRESATVGRLIAGQRKLEEWSPEAIQDLSLYIVLKSRQYKVSPYLVLSLITVESRFHPRIVSPKGAVGLMQLMPETAKEFALVMGLPYRGPISLEDPKFNIELGLRYLQFLRARFPSKAHMLTAYNIGPAALRKKLKNGDELPLGYYQKVMSTMAEYHREALPHRTPSRPAKQWL